MGSLLFGVSQIEGGLQIGGFPLPIFGRPSFQAVFDKLNK